MLSRICEEFKCLPTRALWELEHDPDGLVFAVMDVRAYERAYRTVEDAVAMEKEKDLPDTPLIREVKDNRWGPQLERYRAKKARQAARLRQQG